MKADKEPKEKAERYCVVCRRRKRSVFWKYVPRNEKEREKWEKLLAIPGLKSQLSLCSFHFENKNSSRPLPLTRPEDCSSPSDSSNPATSPSSSTSPSPPSSPRDLNPRSFSSPLINSGSPTKRRTISSNLSPSSISIMNSSRSNSVHSRANRHSASISSIPQADGRSVTLLPTHKKYNRGMPSPVQTELPGLRSPGHTNSNPNEIDHNMCISPTGAKPVGPIISPNSSFTDRQKSFPKFESICEAPILNFHSPPNDALASLAETSEKRLQRVREKEAAMGFGGSLPGARGSSSSSASSTTMASHPYGTYMYAGDHVEVGPSARYFQEQHSSGNGNISGGSDFLEHSKQLPSPIIPPLDQPTRMSFSSNFHTLLSPGQANSFSSITEEKYQPSIPPISSFHPPPRLQQPLPNLLNTPLLDFSTPSSLQQHYFSSSSSSNNSNQFFSRTSIPGNMDLSTLYSARQAEPHALRSPPSSAPLSPLESPKLFSNPNFSSSMVNLTLIKKTFGDFLLNGNGEQVPTEKVFSQAEAVALYFFSHSSQECCNSTHILQFFKKMTSEGKLVEVIFISLDQEGPTFYQSIQQIPWYFIPFSDGMKRERVMKRYNIHFIPYLPYLLFLSPDGNTVKNANEIIFNDPNGIKYPWYPRNLWRILKGTYLVESSGAQYPIQFIQQEKCTILLYVISSKCQSCSLVTLKLMQIYAILKKRCKVKVVLLSTDEDATSFQNCLTICSSWLAIPFELLSARREIFNTYGEGHAPPHLFVVSSSGEILNKDGVTQLNRDPEGQLFPWYQEPVHQLSFSTYQKLYHKPALIYFHPAAEEEGSVVATLSSVAADQRNRMKSQQVDESNPKSSWEGWSLNRRDKESRDDRIGEIEYFFCNDIEMIEELRKITQMELRHSTVFILDLKRKCFSKMALDFSGPMNTISISSFITDWQRGMAPANSLKL